MSELFSDVGQVDADVDRCALVENRDGGVLGALSAPSVPNMTLLA